MENETLKKAQAWAQDPAFAPQFRQEIQTLIDQNNQSELTDRFYKDLEFGTGGLRGILGAGSNRMNIYTVRRATQGLASYILGQKLKDPAVAIACDSRNFSQTFAEDSAQVLAANGIKVYLYESLRPTPMLSFAVRHLKATAGIVITASHNPREYNGYKVSWSDGCQVTAPHDEGIITQVNGITNFGAIKTLDLETAKAKGLVVVIGKEVDEPYYQRVQGLSFPNPSLYKDFGVVYTPLHGAGNLPVRETLKRAGFGQVQVVASQERPDGNFPTVGYPNPEEPAALEEAQKAAGPKDQLILATDPDSDRIGAMARHQGAWQKLNGNQIGQLLFDFYLGQLEQAGKLPKKGHYITTIVTSRLGAKIAQSKGIKVHEVLTGFKYIGEQMLALDSQPGETFVFGTEESHGYLFGDFVRDKDAVSAAMIFAEMAATYHAQGKSLFDRLEEIHRQFGFHSDDLVNQTYKGKEGAEKIGRIMTGLRDHAPQEIGSVKVVEVRDYERQLSFNPQTGQTLGPIRLPVSNVLAFLLEDGSRITARPSGTEPKIKFYFNLTGKDPAGLERQKQLYVADFLKKIETL
ncbi:MAG: hypothetical protein A2600_10170 [Candidatus Lambdaproteobacteria bacterium RIFOXYD1_FULL_56_27]|uniref:Phosphoglucomutase n=1 Tax=Candidatus Lambdaproteobacteria bacterium RIFOXYD2_FULL_56_26 TaxID=1817773 RepID=A0A1F6H1W7_9PROT|nr:MAG: hypothetical protein A2426_12290 [Candidatus Lambdaproteobacteria bacterium RIFOXYC1_FULL_56_13]OGH04342.1 MAG: hypothetical protein A2557_10870 [Candidatus Lambdaproteobacteria bacterium RIFOXYD2_FULL_56_26]OGH08683.1 MAG: hypothetical protein A2600_10170 [Candidatus Lambdaproteobacteria bacterium RIFOXYD1_FULL_56_27]